MKLFDPSTTIRSTLTNFKRFSSAATKNVPSKADVVVVGGGSLGTSALYHLQSHGLNAVLLERHQLTAGTTWHSAGMLWRLRPSDVDIELHAYTRDLIKRLEVEQNSVGSAWTENGGLFIASNKERMAEYERLAETGKYFGIESFVCSPDETKNVHPLIATNDIYASLHSPGDGTIDPTGVVTAYSKAAKQLGAKIFENTGVSSIETEEVGGIGGTIKKVKSLITSDGHRIETPWIVNACGAWSNDLAEMVDCKLPLLAMKHAMVVTEGIPGMHGGLPNVRDHDLSIYLKTQGDAMCIGGYETNPEFWHDVSPDFSFGLFDLDWDTFGQNLEGHMKRCPAIEQVGIKSTVCGPESFTPDHKPLVGPQPKVRGMFNACGFNSMGMMLGGGMGREIAHWIVHDSPSLDLFAFDCSRYHPDSVNNSKWVFDRTHESYAKTYSIVFPHDEALAGRGLRKSALHDTLERRGCVHQGRHGFERPGWFVSNDVNNNDQAPKEYDYYGAYNDGAWRLSPDHDDIPSHVEHRYNDIIEGDLTFDWPSSHAIIAKECYAARNGVAIFDQSYFGKFMLSGKEAKEAVKWLCAADVTLGEIGRVTYTPLCNASGGVEADLTVTKLADDQYYFAGGGNTATRDWEWITSRLDEKGYTSDDIQLNNISDDLCIISIQGPHARPLLQSVMHTSSSKHLEENDSTIDLSNDEYFSFSTSKSNLMIDNYPIDMTLRLTFVGEVGYELHVQNKYANHIYSALRNAGDEYEQVNKVPIRDAGYRAIDSLSAEKGYRHWHADLTNCDTPMEAGIGFTVLPRLKKDTHESGDFLGRKALEHHLSTGPQKKLVCLVLEKDAPPLHGLETLWRNDECVGFVRSTAFGHAIGTTIAYGYVEKGKGETKVTNKWLKSGVWKIGDRGKKLPATLHIKAPFNPSNSRIRGEYDRFTS
jgi:sarcosine dehydrogenase